MEEHVRVVDVLPVSASACNAGRPAAGDANPVAPDKSTATADTKQDKPAAELNKQVVVEEPKQQKKDEPKKDEAKKEQPKKQEEVKKKEKPPFNVEDYPLSR